MSAEPQVPSNETLEILERLIAFPTVSWSSNLGLIEWLRDHLSERGLPRRVCEVDGGEPEVVAFGAEAGLFQDRGIETIVWGPGSIRQAHKPDEYISLEQLTRCERLLDRLLYDPSRLMTGTERRS